MVAKIPSAYSGKIVKLNFKNDEICQVGQSLLDMEVGDDVKVKVEVAEAPEAPKEEAPKTEAPKPEPKPEPKPVAKAEKKHEAAPGDKVLATPTVRGLATEMKVDLTKVTPTGKGGRITKNDVMKYAESMKGSAPAGKKAEEHFAATIPVAMKHDQPKKLIGIQRAMVKSMTDARSIPAHNIQELFCVDEIKKTRKSYLKLNPKSKLTYLPFFIKAFSQAMLEFPIFNSVITSKPGSDGYINEYIQKAEHNISIAIDSPSGLVVPNIKSIQRKPILQINEEVRAVIERGRKATLTHDDLADGSFTLSSIGGIGSRVGTPVIFRPQVAIAAMCRVSSSEKFIKKPDGTYDIKPTELMELSLTCDHRIIDIPTAAKFLSAAKSYIEDIDKLVLSLK